MQPEQGPVHGNGGPVQEQGGEARDRGPRHQVTVGRSGQFGWNGWWLIRRAVNRRFDVRRPGGRRGLKLAANDSSGISGIAMAGIGVGAFALVWVALTVITRLRRRAAS